VLEVAAGWALPSWQGSLVDMVALPVMAALAVWGRERSAPLAVLAVEVAATVPCHMLGADKAVTLRRQITSTLGLEVISMLSDPGEISHASSRLAAF